MKLFLSQHFLIINFLIPLILSLVSVFISNIRLVRLLVLLGSFAVLLLSYYFSESYSRYVMGGWDAPYGIEFVLDFLNQNVIVFANLIFFIFALSLGWLGDILERNSKAEYKKYIYSILFIMHAGTLGILSTFDLFNMYVFIEISSLAAYGLISIGKDRHSVVAALEYLIIGTISATFMLVAIGILYVLTGSLNMGDINYIISDQPHSRLLILSGLFFCFGAILKLALFPLHFWLVRAYCHTESAILTYVSSISVLSGFYVLIRFIHSVLGWDLFRLLSLDQIFSLLAAIGVIFCSYLAYKSNQFRRIIFYSATVQVSYITLMVMNSDNFSMIMQYVIADSISKFIFFAYVALEEDHKNCSNSVYVAILNVISNMGIPITIGFFNKINLLNILLSNSSYLSFVAAILASMIGVSYNYRLVTHLIRHELTQDKDNRHFASLYLATLISFGLIFYIRL